MTISGAMTYNRYRVRRNTTEPGFVFESRNDQVSQTLLIPGLSRLDPNKLFAQGQPGGWADPYDLTKMFIDDAGTTPATIASLGTGIGRVVTKGNAITLTQANAADRPVWGRHPVSGIRNLLSHSEDFSNAFWGKTASSVVSNFLFDNAVNTPHFLNINPGGGTGQTEVFTVWARAGSLPWMGVFIDGVTSFFNLQTGAIGTVAAGLTATIALEVDGFYRCRITRVRANSTTTARIYVTNADNTFSYLGDGTGSIELQKSQLERDTPTPYQRVTNRFDITETGVPSLYYFDANGVNQSWSSNANVPFSTVNKATIWAGIFKRSDAARGMLIELRSGAGGGNFAMEAPTAALNNIAMVSRGDGSTQVAILSRSSPAMFSPVGDANISGPLVRLREGAGTTSVTTTQGAGNYRDGILDVFRRTGSTLPFNGRLYSLIIAGDNYDSRTIQRFSDWLLKPRRLITA